MVGTWGQICPSAAAEAQLIHTRPVVARLGTSLRSGTAYARELPAIRSDRRFGITGDS